jgi:hypothetical protein
MEYFQNRKLLIATKHQKEKVIAPILEKELGVHCFVDKTFDTDTFGTFSGEVERIYDPISTARAKCMQAMKQNNCTLGVASEGSFGPHPSLFFVNADDEFLLFLDTENNIEVMVRELSTSTNFNGQLIKSREALLSFAERKELEQTFDLLYAQYQAVYVETDMRAMYNPTRMKVIETAAQKLVQKIQSVCPQCQMPGFGVTAVQEGLPCSLCGAPTRSTLSYVYVCQHCQFKKEEMYPHKKTTEDPMFCDYCNP